MTDPAAADVEHRRVLGALVAAGRQVLGIEGGEGANGAVVNVRDKAGPLIKDSVA